MLPEHAYRIKSPEAVYVPRAVNASTPIRLGAALSSGLRLSGGLLPLLFALTGARAAQAMVEASLSAALLADGAPALARWGAALALWLIAELAAASVFALAVVKAAARLRGGEGEEGEDSGAWPRLALGYFLVGGAVLIAARLWVWTALGATFTAWLRALLTGEGGGLASFSLALALTVGLPLGLFATLWLRAALARAAVSQTSFPVALYDTASALRARLWTPLLCLLITGAVGAVLSGTAGALTVPLSPRFGAPFASEVGWGVGLVSGALGALGIAFAQLWGLSALTTLAAGAAGVLSPGVLPAPSVPTAPLLPDEPALAVAVPVATLVEEPEAPARSPSTADVPVGSKDDEAP